MPVTAPSITELELPDPLGTHSRRPFRLCLNTSTLRGYGLGLPELVDIAAAAGYESLEPWIEEMQRYEAEGGRLEDLRSKMNDLGLSFESAIGFFNWIDNDPKVRAAGIASARQDMSLVARCGGNKIAAPPWGAHAPDAPRIELSAIADRYRELLESTAESHVAPMLELWGFSTNLSRLGEVLNVVAETAHPGASVLADVYHLYKGGSPSDGIRFLAGSATGLFHINDYPGIAPARIQDADRVYPGDGIAPLDSLLQTLVGNGYRGALSLELFNERYWNDDPLTVARTGRIKLEQAIDRALGWR
jgi:2-keto-myo-inositol isomerase